MTYDNTNKGALFRVEEDKKRENGPDYSGSLNVDGAEFFLDAWINTAKSGQKYMSVRVKQKQQRQEPGTGQTHGEMKAAQRSSYGTPPPRPKSGTGFDDMDDDCPF